MPDPTKVLAILKDPKKRAAIPPAMLEVIEKSLVQKPDATANTPQTAVQKQQEEAHGPMSEVLYNAFAPAVYPGTQKPIELAKTFLSSLGTSRRPIYQQKDVSGDFLFGRGPEDAWSLYLGLPQKHNTIEPSAYRPTDAKDENSSYLKLKGFFNNWDADRVRKVVGALSGTDKMRTGQRDKTPSGRAYLHRNDDYGDSPEELGSTMARYAVSQGKDERGHYISYYDKWDLTGVLPNLVGKPFELYDRLYYDPETFQPVSPKLTGLDLKEINQWAENAGLRTPKGNPR